MGAEGRRYFILRELHIISHLQIFSPVLHISSCNFFNFFYAFRRTNIIMITSAYGTWLDLDQHLLV